MDQPPDEEFEPASTSTDVAPSQYQFTLWQLMVLTLLVSLIAGWFRFIPYREGFLWFYFLYFGGLAAYIVLRIPRITSTMRKERRAAARQREEAIAYAEEARRRKRAGEGK